ncbi:MAG: chromosome segregation protein SMC [Clostridium sp.]|nr:chromosome segregation protein SMC [Clostridium sp.]
MEQTAITDKREGAFLALSRICLNNWHYITKKTLSFHKEINFFTGHSGSGKSTVIDAMQILLYANTDGRGFFNKAAADDSDRNLIEYLRGMVNIGDNNEFSYLRNQNFSTTIVLELKRSDTDECRCVGIVFDVETASNSISRRFFWHKGPLWENAYRTEKRAMSIQETEEYLQKNYNREAYFTTSHNERFRRLLYDSYLGGLDAGKFPLLFKRAIPFRMNIKLEDFVKEYICTEEDIHIEDMQESVMQYGRMRRKIEDTCREIDELKEIRQRFLAFDEKEQELSKYHYFIKKLEILELRARLKHIADKINASGQDLERQKQAMKETEAQITGLEAQSDELLRRISSTGYDELKNQLAGLNELLERLGKSEARWQQTSKALTLWTEEDTASNQTLWDIEEFESRTIDLNTVIRLKDSIQSMRDDAEKQRQETSAFLRDIKRQEKQAKEELEKLRTGNKAYPKYVENARSFLQRRLYEETGKSVDVHVLADLLEIRDDQWRNALEGYLGNNKLCLIVHPRYAGKALEIYGELDKKEYHGAAVLDTEKASSYEASPEAGSICEEIRVRESYLQPYIHFLLGKLIKCSSVEELRSCRMGVTPDCMLYHSFRLQHMNPDSYTKYAYIGKDSVRKRIRLLEKEILTLEAQKKPQEELLRECERILLLEPLAGRPEEYMEWLQDMEDYKSKEREKKKLVQKLETLKAQNVDQLEEERRAVTLLCDGKKRERDERNRLIHDKEREIGQLNQETVEKNEALLEREADLKQRREYDEELTAYLSGQEYPRYDRERERFTSLCHKLSEERESARSRLIDIRTEYLRNRPNRNFPVSAGDNQSYDRLLDALQCEHLEEYKAKATEQAKAAVEHFRDDFIYKIRSAIREALIRKDELNRIISRLDFGKDKYQFVIGRNRGLDGRYYDMFMDDALEVNPACLNQSFENQMDLFTIEHEQHYGQLMNELISIFIPPENAAPEQMEEARRNMDKYADYRTYLSFDMQQLVQNEDEVIKIRLSKMIKKNSGGEGQNPLYVALLASFAQAYRISLSPRIERSPTIRLVVLDEAFSKMDGEKVASCIQLIRGLGFQAVISATNDKIQNYVENVDKTFVFANPNKKSISIQEFERDRLTELVKDIQEDGY